MVKKVIKVVDVAHILNIIKLFNITKIENIIIYNQDIQDIQYDTISAHHYNLFLI